MSSNQFSLLIRTFYDLSLDELYEILRLRQEVFVVEQTCPYMDLDNKDQKSLHLLGFYGGKIVSYCRLLPEGVSYPGFTSIGRVITSKEVRGYGFGKIMLQEAIQTLNKLYPKYPIKIGAQKYLNEYYASLGFIDQGIEYLEDNIWHIIMVKYG
ncbi:MAG: GNAT family N-acetyltransferase [Saprospiraceae bacterium]